jgi:hypothetical protein
MSMLGLVALTKQKNVAESGLSKTLDRIDANSMLAIISKDIEQTLQVAIDLAAEYAGIEAPVVAIDRDFNTEPMQGQEITAINSLFTSGLLDQQTALELLKRGEVFDDSIDVEEILANAEAEQLKDMEQQLERQEAQMELSAEYAGIEAPVVAIDRDFNTEPMQGQEITAINTLFTSGLLDQQTALKLLQRGEILTDEMDVEEILAAAETEQLQSMEQDLQKLDAEAQIAAANAPAVAPKQPMPPKG